MNHAATRKSMGPDPTHFPEGIDIGSLIYAQAQLILSREVYSKEWVLKAVASKQENLT